MLLNFKDTEKSSLNQSICVYQIKCVPKTNSLTHYYAFKLLYTKGKEWHSEVISKYVILTNCSYYHYNRTKLRAPLMSFVHGITKFYLRSITNLKMVYPGSYERIYLHYCIVF